MTVPLPCDEKLGPLQLPVRTVDGRVHQLEVRAPDSEVLEQDRTMCGQPEQTHSYVTATLVGTPDRPLLRFANQSAQARRIWLQSELGSLVPMPGVVIRLSPSLPHDIDPQGIFNLRISVHVNRCIRDVASYEQAQLWLGFLDTDIGRHEPPGDNDWQNVMGTSIGSIVTAAMLQPPVLDMARDPAANYGAFGALVGHELTHGFDGKGRLVATNGQLRDWWTVADAAAWDMLLDLTAARAVRSAFILAISASI